jgi:selenide,water dikinase
VPGFGLLGHLGAVARESGATARLDSKKVPAIDARVLELIDEGCVPGGTKANLLAAHQTTRFAATVPDSMRLLLADAQTSGGLLLAVAPANLEEVLQVLAEEKAPCAVVIGEIIASTGIAIEVS